MIHDSQATLIEDFLGHCAPRPLPGRVLMCPPAYFDVVDVKNPHMEGQIGRVDRSAAAAQWQRVHDTFSQCGIEVREIVPTPGCEDMVFCANQTLAGIAARPVTDRSARAPGTDPREARSETGPPLCGPPLSSSSPGGARVCLLSNMRHESRQREVAAFAEWFRSEGYQIEAAPRGPRLEGSGDAIWHPGRGLIWGGHGHRSEPAAYERVAAVFGVPVLRLKLLSNRFYHLDTCFCAIDERTVLIDPRCFEPRGLALIRAVFERVIEAPPDEAEQGMACNATALLGRHVVIQRGNVQTTAALRGLGYEVHEVETGEFLKSGGSVFCMKMYLF